MAFWIALAQGGRGPGNEAGLGLGFCFLVEDKQEDTFMTLYIPYHLSLANLWEDIWWHLLTLQRLNMTPTAKGKMKYPFRQNTEKLDLIQLLSFLLTRYIE